MIVKSGAPFASRISHVYSQSSDGRSMSWKWRLGWRVLGGDMTRGGRWGHGCCGDGDGGDTDVVVMGAVGIYGLEGHILGHTSRSSAYVTTGRAPAAVAEREDLMALMKLRLLRLRPPQLHHPQRANAHHNPRTFLLDGAVHA